MVTTMHVILFGMTEQTQAHSCNIGMWCRCAAVRRPCAPQLLKLQQGLCCNDEQGYQAQRLCCEGQHADCTAGPPLINVL